MNNVDAEKKSARQKASQIRKQLFSSECARAAAQNFLKHISLETHKVVSLYLPIGSELNVLPLSKKLQEQGIRCALPIVTERGSPLVFRLWADGDVLEKDIHDIRVPATEAPVVTPDVVIVPLLRFDKKGYRLGYGGGYYDRTLEKLRQDQGCVAVGYAYAGQEVKNVPRNRHDQPLDWVVTELEARKFQ